MADRFALSNGAHLSNFGKLEDGLYRCAQPDLAALPALENGLGIKTVVNLRGPGEDGAEREALMKLGFHLEETPEQIVVRYQVGLRYIPMPLPGFHESNPDHFADILNLMADTRLRPLLFHCRRGADRTGTIAACYRMWQQGWSTRAALDEAAMFGMSDLEILMRAFVIGFGAAQIVNAGQPHK